MCLKTKCFFFTKGKDNYSFQDIPDSGPYENPEVKSALASMARNGHARDQAQEPARVTNEPVRVTHIEMRM